MYNQKWAPAHRSKQVRSIGFWGLSIVSCLRKIPALAKITEYKIQDEPSGSCHSYGCPVCSSCCISHYLHGQRAAASIYGNVTTIHFSTGTSTKVHILGQGLSNKYVRIMIFLISKAGRNFRLPSYFQSRNLRLYPKYQ